MACGEKRRVLESFWTWCTFHWHYPCRLRYCTIPVTYPCGMTTCWTTVRVPCGIRWCRKWGIRYPCGVRYCGVPVPYPCPVYCTTWVTLPCGFEYCRGTGSYPCRRIHEVTKYCYDYSSAIESCTIVANHITFCCGGQEYSDWDTCLGLVSGNYAAGTVCFDETHDPSGPCTDMSVPGGAPAGPLDPGSVAPHGSGLSSATRLRHLAVAIRSKLGVCAKCMRGAVLISATSWMAVVLFTDQPVLCFAFLVAAALSTALLLAHLIAFVVRRVPSSAPCGSCG